MELNVDEKRAVEAASGAVGDYLERIGKSDLAQMSEAEWLGFLSHAYASVAEEVRNIWAREVPF